MRRRRSTSPALPPLSINSQPQPVCLPGLALRSRGRAGGSVLKCGDLMRGTQHRARHTVGALDLFISTLWTRTSQRQRRHKHEGLWESGVGEDQKKLPKPSVFHPELGSGALERNQVQALPQGDRPLSKEIVQPPFLVNSSPDSRRSAVTPGAASASPQPPSACLAFLLSAPVAF